MARLNETVTAIYNDVTALEDAFQDRYNSGTYFPAGMTEDDARDQFHQALQTPANRSTILGPYTPKYIARKERNARAIGLGIGLPSLAAILIALAPIEKDQKAFLDAIGIVGLASAVTCYIKKRPN